jgi:hypothetical protein
MAAIIPTINEYDIGWMYCPPSRRKFVPSEQRQQVEDESFFQRQMQLNQKILDQTEPRRSVLKESDSKYVRLAKLGGRSDLISMNLQNTASKPSIPVADYKRCEWFYPEVPVEDKNDKSSQPAPVAVMPRWFVHSRTPEPEKSQLEREIVENKVHVMRTRVPFATDENAPQPRGKPPLGRQPMRASRQKKRTEKPKVEERRARSEQRRPSPGAARAGASNLRAKEASREPEQRSDVLNALADRDLGRQVRNARETTRPNAHAETGAKLRHYTLPTAPAVTRTEYRDKFRLQAAAIQKLI